MRLRSVGMGLALLFGSYSAAWAQIDIINGYGPSGTVLYWAAGTTAFDTDYAVEGTGPFQFDLVVELQKYGTSTWILKAQDTRAVDSSPYAMTYTKTIDMTDWGLSEGDVVRFTATAVQFTFPAYEDEDLLYGVMKGSMPIVEEGVEALTPSVDLTEPRRFESRDGFGAP
ncbi:MAG: hypothetical protein HY716_14815 [Planctomycetes bacterium]|nr:hypothetical protein [Planctomycetota bacterium]